MRLATVGDLPRRLRGGMRRPSTETLQREIARLVVRRQELRARGASEARLERNRRKIAQCQRRLARALIEQYRRSAERAAA